MTTKTCSKCGVEKTLDMFSKNKKGRKGVMPQCKDCRREYYAERYKSDKNYREICLERARVWYKVNGSGDRKYYMIKRKYGITKEDYEVMLSSQGGRCCICGDQLTTGKGVHIDHCHTSNKIRGILCTYCNPGLGMFRDNVEYLSNAIAYLEKHRDNTQH